MAARSASGGRSARGRIGLPRRARGRRLGLPQSLTEHPQSHQAPSRRRRASPDRAVDLRIGPAIDMAAAHGHEARGRIPDREHDRRAPEEIRRVQDARGLGHRRGDARAHPVALPGRPADWSRLREPPPPLLTARPAGRGAGDDPIGRARRSTGTPVRSADRPVIPRPNARRVARRPGRSRAGDGSHHSRRTPPPPQRSAVPEAAGDFDHERAMGRVSRFLRQGGNEAAESSLPLPGGRARIKGFEVGEAEASGRSGPGCLPPPDGAESGAPAPPERPGPCPAVLRPSLRLGEPLHRPVELQRDLAAGRPFRFFTRESVTAIWPQVSAIASFSWLRSQTLSPRVPNFRLPRARRQATGLDTCTVRSAMARIPRS